MVRTKPRKSDDVKRNVPKNSAGRASKNSRETQALGMSDDYEKNTRKDSRSKERDGISEEAHSLFQQVKPFQFYANFLHNLMEEQVDGRSPKRAGGKRGSSNSQVSRSDCLLIMLHHAELQQFF
ncbi:hypothetical protein ANCCAN_23579 [Ancylostoma caninum]|uniref:Uncharacterized protein n=1 Tax=Ancylostoma caninum TaxID=29170 RepID=A0A368FID3_ANCCA|nr:hypothetical protein ANCCAN_23579 [Ancylostoma caninum]